MILHTPEIKSHLDETEIFLGWQKGNTFRISSESSV